jgi:hypothetical protein
MMVFLSLNLNHYTMGTKSDTSKLRLLVFSYLDSILTSTTALALYKKGVLNYVLKQNKVSLNNLATLHINLLKGKP